MPREKKEPPPADRRIGNSAGAPQAPAISELRKTIQPRFRRGSRLYTPRSRRLLLFAYLLPCDSGPVIKGVIVANWRKNSGALRNAIGPERQVALGRGGVSS